MDFIAAVSPIYQLSRAHSVHQKFTSWGLRVGQALLKCKEGACGPEPCRHALQPRKEPGHVEALQTPVLIAIVMQAVQQASAGTAYSGGHQYEAEGSISQGAVHSQVRSHQLTAF